MNPTTSLFCQGLTPKSVKDGRNGHSNHHSKVQCSRQTDITSRRHVSGAPCRQPLCNRPVFAPPKQPPFPQFHVQPTLLPQNSLMSDAYFHLPIVEMTRIESFSAAHRLHNDSLTAEHNVELYGKCNNANGHGHNYKWEVTLRGPVIPITGMVYDLAELKREMAFVLEQIDHKNIDLDVPYFRDHKRVSTSENIAIFLYDSLYPTLGDLLKQVKLYETDKNVFVYRGEHTSN